MRKVLKYTKIGGLIAAPIVLLLLPSNFFDGGESICLSWQLFGIECYACGMTRAVMHLIHFDFQAAYDYNVISYAVVPLLGLVWLEMLLFEFGIIFPFMSPAYKRKKALQLQQRKLRAQQELEARQTQA